MSKIKFFPDAAEPEQEVAAPEAPPADAPIEFGGKLAQSEPSFRLMLTPRLRAIVHANYSGRALNSEIAELWSALYEAAGPAEAPAPRTYGK